MQIPSNPTVKLIFLQTWILACNFAAFFEMNG
jgi:hypothetical protein